MKKLIIIGAIVGALVGAQADNIEGPNGAMKAGVEVLNSGA